MDKTYLLNEIEKLTFFPTVSGNEVALYGYLSRALKGHGKIFVDKKGNFIALKGKKQQVALVAHADKIGFMVGEKVDSNLFKVVQLKKSQKTKFAHGPICTVVLTHRGEIKPFAQGLLVNLSEDALKSELCVEVLSGRELGMGDLVSFRPNFVTSGDFIVSQGLDNKLGLLAAVEAYKRLDACILIASAQEEMPSKQVTGAIYELQPKEAIVVDVTYAQSSIKLGGGPTICLKDTLIPSLNIVKTLQSASKKAKVSVQYEVLEEGSSDAVAIENVGSGVQFCFVGIPIKYIHTPLEMANIGDVNKCIDLLVCAVGGKEND